MSERLSVEEALALLRDGDLADLMGRADRRRRELHGARTCFAHSLNLNPTNICENRCELCAFWREAGSPDAYVTDLGQARDVFLAAQGWGLTDVHIVGGLHPDLGLAYFESLIALSRELLPEALVQGMTAVEIDYLARREALSLRDVIARLQTAGLGAVPGGGAEIFAGDVRERICSQKISAERWLEVHETAHALGLPTNATLLFGHIETPEHVVDHLERLRSLQDRTGGLQAFIALPFHVEGTRMAVDRGPSGHAIARTVALARLFLDNVPHVRVLANYMDRKLLQTLVHSGADDVGGTSLDERIAKAAGAPDAHKIASPDDMAAFIESLGLEPVLVNSAYETSASEVARAAPVRTRDDSGAVRETLARAEAGERLSAEEAVALHEGASVHDLGRVAHRRRCERLGGGQATFVIDRNLSTTNVCEAGCRFCAFHVAPGSDRAFALTVDQVVEQAVEAEARGATQLMLQGGLNPELDLGFYEAMLSAVKAHTNLWLHSLSPAEILYLARRAGLSVSDAIERLRDAGLDSLPGGGAEILVDAVRERVSPRKISADDWFGVMAAAHALGMKTTATMVYGLGETAEQRIEHLVRVREVQDRTGGFTAFIPWSFQPDHTRLSLPPQTAVDYLRVVALARLVLDNVPHIQAGWVTEGPDVAQIALSYGCDDFGGVLMEERVVRATGVSYAVTAEQVVGLIRAAGMTPVQRTTQYDVVRTFE